MSLRKLFGGIKNKKTGPLKTINYRGGLLTFAIPTSWVEHYDDDGGGIFYDETPDSGTLRLNLVTFSAPAGETVFDIHDEVRTKAVKHNGTARSIQEDVALVTFDSRSAENGNVISTRFWHVYNLVPPDHLRLAVFSYTILGAQVNDPRFMSELKKLNDEIAKVSFAKNIVVSGGSAI